MKNQQFENEAEATASTAPETGRAGDARTRAEAWLKRGQLCEASGTAEGWCEAVRCQEAALAAASEMPGEGEAGLVARIWMNRGNALLGRGEAESAREAVRSYDRALVLLTAGAATGSAEGGMMAGAAWLNRAAAVQAAGGGETGREEAGVCLERAIAWLTPLAEAHRPARRNLAGAWMNRADWLRAGGDGTGAQAAWRRVAHVAAGEAGRDAAMLELTLRARHALCVELGKRLVAGAPAPSEAEASGIGAEAEGLVGAGLAEFAAWRGTAPGSRVTAARLFEFGAWFYRTRRPDRLAEFLKTHAEAGDERRAEIARAAIHLARQEILRMDFAELLNGAGEARRAILQALRAVEERLGARTEGAGE